jgi:hypothetical protein
MTMEPCCKIGSRMRSCSENGIDQYFHEPPVGLCRAAMKLCCLMEPKKPKCDSDFIISNFDRFCNISRTINNEACCVACQIGVEIARENNSCDRITFLDDSFIRDLVLQCCEKSKRISRNVEKNSVSCGHGFYYNSKTNNCEDINECEIENNGCSKNQVCENRIGSYVCEPKSICRTGYNFVEASLTCRQNCMNPVIVENFTLGMGHLGDLLPAPSSNISVNVIYKPLNCPQGFIIDKYHQKCVDINECKVKKLCDHFCQNTEGSFRCFCKRGYRVNPANKTTCLDINECHLHKNLCSHECKNVKGSFRCLCPKGFKLGPNRKTCEDVNECIEKKKTCGKRICNNLIGNYACYDRECPVGYAIVWKTNRNDYK